MAAARPPTPAAEVTHGQAGTESPAADHGGPVRLLLVIGVVLVAANLRPAISAVGPLLSEIRLDLGLSSTAAALLTATPVLCFGLLAPLAPRLADRFGLERVLGAVLGGIVIGALVRIGPSVATLFGGTILLGGAIALANVLLPALIKRDFPTRAGLLTGAYVTALTVAASAAAGLTVPIADALGFGWRGGLAIWIVPVLVGLVVWLPQLPYRTRPLAADAPRSFGRLRHDPIAWELTLFFGIQSLIFYSVISWLPSIYQSHGFSPSQSGYLLGIATLVGAPAALIVPTLATRAPDQRSYILIVCLLTAMGLAGIMLAPTALPLLWVVLLGVGLGGSFPLALTLLVLRTRTSTDTARLSGMVQSIGYLIAATGPIAVGALFDLTGEWTAPVALLLALVVPQALFGLGAARRRFVMAAPGAAESPGAPA